MSLSIDEIKIQTLKALMSDQELMYGLVLKGGNALHLAYDISNRGSIDIDFSIKGSFSQEEYARLKSKFDALLNNQFSTKQIVAYDVHFYEKPKQGKVPNWLGYCLEFKLVARELFDTHGNDIDKIRRESIKINGQSTKYKVDISAFEYVEGSSQKEIDGVLLNVYSPEMIVVEKLRALCQSMGAYKNIVPSSNTKQRARDIYDIEIIRSNFKSLNITKELIENIFEAKSVPVKFLGNIHTLREQNRQGWDTVIATVSPSEKLLSYDDYFDRLQEFVNFINTKILN
ncbi:nucleotidyl transferase AbiEii/AbiGii toxin family protein [Capnocytophaga canis]|uniref:nucleotidyl transferase AbiEii/AbiGii toxin family protein n=1 Tax=Capnocytophaga canis TaxID=1848903 RepID=UPI001562240C|nr:nucleotidyl transferase AbiEii/AbiGii toxin family protein [Capnocytophaga canis]